MLYDEFSNRLKKLQVSKKEFAEETGLSQSSVTNWKSAGKVPSWVRPFLDRTEKAKAYDKVKDLVLELENQNPIAQ